MVVEVNNRVTGRLALITGASGGYEIRPSSFPSRYLSTALILIRTALVPPALTIFTSKARI